MTVMYKAPIWYILGQLLDCEQSPLMYGMTIMQPIRFSIDVTIVNRPPADNIFVPEGGFLITEGESITFERDKFIRFSN